MHIGYNLTLHPNAAVGHGDCRVIAGSDFGLLLPVLEDLSCRFDDETPAIGHGVATVDCEVQKRVFELVGIDQHRPDPLR